MSLPSPLAAFPASFRDARASWLAHRDIAALACHRPDRSALGRRPGFILKNNSGLGGSNVCLVLRAA